MERSPLPRREDGEGNGGAQLRDADLPSLFIAADVRANENRDTWYRSSAARLVLLVVAAAAGTVLPNRAAGAVGGATFVVILLIEAFKASPATIALWLRSRSLAEEARSVAWRYAVGGSPFALEGGDLATAKERFLNELDRLTQRAREADIHLGDDQGSFLISPPMRQLRQSAWEVRREAYERARIAEQIDWYGKKQSVAHRMARRWWNLALAAQLAGAVAAFLLAAGVVSVSLLGVASTVAAAAVGWSETRTHSRLAREYGTARSRLLSLHARLADQTPERWGAFVAMVEDALLAENRAWVHSREGA